MLEFPHGVSGKVAELKIKSKQTSVGTTNPELLYYNLVCAIRPDPTRVYNLTATLQDDQQILNGGIESKSAGDLAQIRKWNASPADVTLFTPDEPAGKAVLFMPGTLRVRQSDHEVGRRPSYEVSFQLAEVLGWR